MRGSTTIKVGTRAFNVLNQERRRMMQADIRGNLTAHGMARLMKIRGILADAVHRAYNPASILIEVKEADVSDVWVGADDDQ